MLSWIFWTARTTAWSAASGCTGGPGAGLAVKHARGGASGPAQAAGGAALVGLGCGASSNSASGQWLTSSGAIGA
eukprot:4982275-Lingulodinium_polyedra.AAC.1